MRLQALPRAPPPPKKKRSRVGSFLRLGVHCLVPPIFPPKGKLDFIGDIRTRMHYKTLFYVITTQTQFRQSDHFLIIMSEVSF